MNLETFIIIIGAAIIIAVTFRFFLLKLYKLQTQISKLRTLVNELFFMNYSMITGIPKSKLQGTKRGKIISAKETKIEYQILLKIFLEFLQSILRGKKTTNKKGEIIEFDMNHYYLESSEKLIKQGIFESKTEIIRESLRRLFNEFEEYLGDLK